LLEFETREAIPIFRKNLYGKYGINTGVVNVLGNLRATEAVEDLLKILDLPHYSTDGKATNQTFEVANAAVALAKIGHPKTWTKLIDAAENPNFTYGSAVFVELNRSLDSDLWGKIQLVKVFGEDYKSIKENSELFSRESNIPIFLEYQPGKDNFRTQPSTDLSYPGLRAGYEKSLSQYLRAIISSIDSGTLPQRFTFIFDKGRVRILSVEKAAEWWRKNILVK
jgi:hypothetical protein